MKSALFATLISLNALAEPMAIYGEDSRKDVYTVTNSLYVTLAKSTAAMIDKMNLKQNGNVTTISARSLGDMYKLCPEERFRQQPTAANCSGTLVAPDVIMTAAHCYDLGKRTCKENAWVFDYRVSKENQSSVSVYNSSVYECAEILLIKYDLANGIDHALIKLNRPVTDRGYAKVRSLGAVKVGDPLVLIGHPSGLPTKIAADAYVLQVALNSFTSNVDAFSVNSGSGVFNGNTGEVEGILSSGQMDYDGSGNCSTLRRYEMNQGKETVMKIDAVKKFLDTYSPRRHLFGRLFNK